MPALQTFTNLTFYNAWNDNILYYGKATPGEGRLPALRRQSRPAQYPGADFEVPLWEFGLPDQSSIAGGGPGDRRALHLDGQDPARAARSERPALLHLAADPAGGGTLMQRQEESAMETPAETQADIERERQRQRDGVIDRSEIGWFKDAIIYQLHIKAFMDANGDGIGDFEGLKQRLDYIASLGINTIWLLPFYPSPLRDDGYDIADYRSINPSFGEMRDLRRFIRAAHRRGIRVITELVINHTSDQHPWFQRARRAKPGSAARDYYVWSDTDQKYLETRIIFIDTEKSNWTWDPVAHAFFWHRFYSHQPDLNFDNPKVMEEVLRLMHYWLDMGIDGLRLDAIPYLIEREGTNNENLPETHDVLKRIRAEMDAYYPDRLLLAEANQWPEDTRPYFGEGDECHMAFHFPLMPRMYMAVAQEDRHPITDIIRQTPDIPESCQWAIFLRNHDELTLEMVTAEERDYLWKTYAKDKRARINLGIRRRLAPLMDNDRRKIELMNALLLSMPGTPTSLLRRRARHGRQLLSRRPRRRAHADAVVGRPQWRLQPRQPAGALPAADPGPGLRLPGGQRRSAAERAVIAPELGAPDRCGAGSSARPSAAAASPSSTRATARSSPTSAASRASGCCASRTSRARRRRWSSSLASSRDRFRSS